MSAFRLRGALRSVAATVLATLLVGFVHLPAGEDRCVPSAPESHDESKHVFAPINEPSHGHCAICHWQRLQRPDFTQLAVELPALLSCAELASCADTRLHLNSCAQLPARAPPTNALT
jgi:hypothetical protein